MAEAGVRPQSGSIRPTYVVFFIAIGLFVLSCLAGYFYEYRETPDLRANTVINEVRAYRDKNNKWPARFEQLGEVRALGIGGGAKIGANGRTLVVGNYLYVYTPYASVASLWAIPVGNNREYAQTHYVVFNGEAMGDHWVGKALDDAKLQYAVGDPGEARLVHLGMEKVPKQTREREGSEGGPRRARSKSGDEERVTEAAQGRR
jgi:hypothetical protein